MSQNHEFIVIGNGGERFTCRDPRILDVSGDPQLAIDGARLVSGLDGEGLSRYVTKLGDDVVRLDVEKGLLDTFDDPEQDPTLENPLKASWKSMNFASLVLSGAWQTGGDLALVPTLLGGRRWENGGAVLLYSEPAPLVTRFGRVSRAWVGGPALVERDVIGTAFHDELHVVLRSKTNDCASHNNSNPDTEYYMGGIRWEYEAGMVRPVLWRKLWGEQPTLLCMGEPYTLDTEEAEGVECHVLGDDPVTLSFGIQNHLTTFVDDSDERIPDADHRYGGLAFILRDWTDSTEYAYVSYFWKLLGW